MNGFLSKNSLSQERFFPILLSLFCLMLYIPNLGGRDLWCGRESLYAEIARETLLNGHWFVPYFNGEIYYNKPPLYFWLIALASIPAGDVTEFTLRLPSALSAMGTVLVVYFLGRRLYGARTGLLAGIMLATSPGFHQYACVAKLEAPLTLFITSSIFAFYIGLTDSRSKRKHFLWGWFLMGLAMLTKGLGVALIVPVIFLYLLSRRELRRVWEIEPLRGGLILSATMLVWLLPAYMIGGDYYIQGIIGHFGTHVGQGPIYTKPFYYITELFTGTLPWSLIIPAVFFYLRGGVDGKHREGLRLSAVWFAAMWVVFSAIMAKRSRYILPMYPAVALAAAVLWGHYIDRASETWSRIKVLSALALSSIAGVAVVLMMSRNITLTPFAGNSIALCLIALLIVWWLSLRACQYKVLFISFLVTITAFETAYTRLVLPWKSKAGAEKAVYEKAAAHMEPASAWTLYRFFSPDYVFYGRTHIRTIETEKELAKFLSSKERVYCIVGEADYARLDLSAFNVSAFKITELEKIGKKTVTRFVLVSNRPDKAEKTTPESEK